MRPTLRTRATPSLAALVDAEVDRLDGLVAAVRAGIRSPAHYAELEEQADAIGTRLRAAFRSNR
ncbi:MAG: hypothetical protein WCZ28_11310 [Burkholderiaceae bacterium]